jgi:hypothetical protein
MRSSWDALAAGEGGLTATLAGFSAVYFLRRHARRASSGRQTAALALGLSAAGAALGAVHSVAGALGGEPTGRVSLLVGLPALAGQALIALLVLRRRR